MPAQLIYNSIALDINRLQYSREAVDLGPNNATTRHLLRCQAIYNPSATAYKRGPKKSGIFETILAPTTDIAIRNALMQKRKPLTYQVGGIFLLKSPWPVAGPQPVALDANKRVIPKLIDEKNGPNPISCNVQAIHGNRTFAVEFVIETWVNEARIGTPISNGDLSTNPGRNNPPTDQIILSNVYEQEDDIDEHFFLTRTTRGKAMLNTAMLAAFDDELFKINGRSASGTPDFFRNLIMGNGLQLVPPNAQLEQFRAFTIPPNCQRSNINVWVGEDNNMIRYSFVDRERAFNIIATNFPNVTEIRCVQTRNMLSADEMSVAFSRGLAAALGGVIGAIVGGNKADFAFLGINFKGLGANLGAAAGAGLLWEAAKFLPSNMPRIEDRWDIEVFGNRNCTKTEMLSCATQIVDRQLTRTKQQGFIGGFVGSTKTRTSFDLLGKHLIASFSVELGFLGQVATVLAQDVKFRMPTADVFGEGVDDNALPVFTSAQRLNPAPPGDGQTRGTVTRRIEIQRPV